MSAFRPIQPPSSTEIALIPGRSLMDQTTLVPSGLEAVALHSEPAHGSSRPARAALLKEGEVLAQRFQILRFLGRGGMGEVYAAEDRELQERVALKLLLSMRTVSGSPMDPAAALRRFRQEIHMARRVTHPHVCRTYDVFRHRKSEREVRVFLTMELLAGETLSARLRREGALPLGTLLPILQQLISALDAAHAAQVVHRDFKGGNVMLVPVAGSDEVRAVVTDFGLAHSALPEEVETATHEGILMGSLGYLAPELFDGESATPASDIFALGVVLHQMLTGRHPGQDDDGSVEPPSRWVEGLHPVWDEVVERCLAPEPHHRFERAGDLLATLERVDGALALDPSPTTSRRGRVAVLERLLLRRERGLPPESEGSRGERDGLEGRIDQLVQQLMVGGRRGPGDTVAGTRLIRPIGSGNFATIWLAEQLEDGAAVATKIFHPDKLGQGIMVWRFRRSLRAMRLITQHRERPKNIVTIHRAEEDGLAFSMDYLEGGDLEGVARRGWSLGKKIDLFLEICQAVAFAHRLGVIHRDIKPANVVLDGAGKPVLTDFDIADIRFVTRLSVSGGGLGTPVFAAPEQLEDGEKADERSDVYSLGRLLYYLLLERSPGIQIERDPELENLGAYPSALVAVVRRAVQWRPRDRFPTVEALLSAIQQHRRLRSRLLAHWSNARRWMRRNAAVLAIMMLLMSGAVAFGLFQGAVAERERAAAERERVVSEQLRIAQRELAEVQRQLAEFREELRRKSEARMNLREGISRLEAQLQLIDLKIGTASGAARRDLVADRAEVAARLAEQQELDEALRREIANLEAKSQAADARVERLLRTSQAPDLPVLPSPPATSPAAPPPPPRSFAVPESPPPTARQQGVQSPPPRMESPVSKVGAAPLPEPLSLEEVAAAVAASDRAVLPRLIARGRVDESPALLAALAWAVEALGGEPSTADEIRKRAGIETRTVFLSEFPSQEASIRLVRIAGGTVGILEGGPVPVRPFWMGATEITVGQWEAVMGSGGKVAEDDAWKPVHWVSWKDAREFCQRLTARRGASAGGRYRLPTEAEWLHAAGVARDARGATWLDHHAWHRGNSGGEPQTVATLPPNRRGLHDLFGNVWEWIGERYTDSRLPKKRQYVPQQLTFSGGSATYLPLRFGGGAGTLGQEFRSPMPPVDLGDAVRQEGFRVVWIEEGQTR
jgi:serine/threonine protein kinase/formylglycine-generating enzyme required for sulfatase activity